MKTTLAIIILLAVVVVGYVLIFGQGTTTATQPVQTSQSVVKTFTIVGANFSFTPNQITVNKGDTVKIIFQDSDGHHNLSIDGYNVQTQTIDSGQTSEITFIADKTGSFQYYCSVPTHKDRGMVGTLTVE